VLAAPDSASTALGGDIAVPTLKDTPQKLPFHARWILVCFAVMISAPPRTLLVLGRVAGLPTVWSNVLAGWWLGGGGNYWKLQFLFLGVSLLYTGGMFLNDAFDEESDRHRRTERPIPSGKISGAQVWKLGFAQLGLGILLLSVCGMVPALGAVLLAITILLYNFAHQFLTASPWLLGACRFWVYIIASAAGLDGLNGFSIFCGAALACYVAGANFATHRSIGAGNKPAWPFVMLTVPVILALMMNSGSYLKTAIWISAVCLLWIARCLKDLFLGGQPNAPWLTTNLFAGIVFVDWLAVAPVLEPWKSAVVFLTLFGATKWFQKAVPVA
jgi:4-hydroxybenzoate polyprenyltransferase